MLLRTAGNNRIGCALHNSRVGSAVHKNYADFALIFSFPHRRAEIALEGRLADESPF